MGSAQGWQNVPDRLMASRDAAQLRGATALSLLFFVAPAWAADDSGGATALIAAAAIQIVIALVVGVAQAGRNRLVQLADERLKILNEEVSRDRTAHQNGLTELRHFVQTSYTELAGRIATTRESYVSRADFEARLDRLETSVRDLRKETQTKLDLVSGQNAEILAYLKRLEG